MSHEPNLSSEHNDPNPEGPAPEEVSSSNPPSARDIVLREVSKFWSTLSIDEFPYFCERYDIGPEYRLVLPEPHERADMPGRHGVYRESLMAGLRYPLSPFALSVLEHYQLHPAQLTPNSWMSIQAFFLRLRDSGLEPSLDSFTWGHVLRRVQDEEGWYSLAQRREFNCFSHKPDNHKGWKSRFFFLESPLAVEREMSWKDHRSVGRFNQKLGTKSEQAHCGEALSKLGTVPIREMLVKEDLASHCKGVLDPAAMKFNPQSFAANLASAKKVTASKKPPPGPGSSSAQKPSSALAVAEPAKDTGSGRGAAKRKSQSSPASASSSKRGKSTVASPSADVGSGEAAEVPYHLQKVDGKALYVPQWSVLNGSTVFGHPDVGVSMIENIATPRDVQEMSERSTARVRTDFAHAIAASATLAKHIMDRLSVLSDFGETQQGTIQDQQERIRILNEELSSLKGAGEEVETLKGTVAELEGKLKGAKEKLKKAEVSHKANLESLSKKYKAQLEDALKKAVDSYKLSKKFESEQQVVRAAAVEDFKRSEQFQKELDLYAQDAHVHGCRMGQDVLLAQNPSLAGQALSYEDAMATWQRLEASGLSSPVPSTPLPDPAPVEPSIPASPLPSTQEPEPASVEPAAPMVIEDEAAEVSGVALEKPPV